MKLKKSHKSSEIPFKGISKKINSLIKKAENTAKPIDTNVQLNEISINNNSKYELFASDIWLNTFTQNQEDFVGEINTEDIPYNEINENSFEYEINELFLDTFCNIKEDIKYNVFLNEPVNFTEDNKKTIRSDINALFKENITKEEKEKAKEIIISDKKAKAINTYQKQILKKLYLFSFKNKLFIYTKPIWRELTQYEFITKIKNFSDFNDDLEYFSEKLFKELYSSVITSPQIQVKKEELKNGENLIAFKDGVYNVYNNKIYSPSPDFKFFSYIDVSINELDENTCHFFDIFVENASNGDKNWRTLLLEILGCIISGFNPKTFFVFWGPKNTGKSEFANFCKLLIGEEFCLGIRGPNAFAERWTIGSLFGKKLCLASDISNSIINSEAVAAIKSVTGNDWISGEYKYKQPFSFKNEASILFCSNHKLQISSFDEAFWDRLIYLPFRNSVPKEARIPNLAEKLFDERGYIVCEAINALQKLVKRNFVFTKVDLPDENTLISNESNSVNEFIAEKCIENENDFIAFSYIYDIYCIFCNKNEYTPLNKIEFSRKFKTAITEVLPNVEFKPTAKAKGYKNLTLLND